MTQIVNEEPFVKIVREQPISRKSIQYLLCSLLETSYPSWLANCNPGRYAEGLTHPDFKEGGKMQDPEDYFPYYAIMPVTDGCSIDLVVENPLEGKPFLHVDVDAKLVRMGLQIMASKYPRHFEDFVTENDDAETADVFGQCMVYGEIVYG